MKATGNLDPWIQVNSRIQNAHQLYRMIFTDEKDAIVLLRKDPSAETNNMNQCCIRYSDLKKISSALVHHQIQQKHSAASAPELDSFVKDQIIEGDFSIHTLIQSAVLVEPSEMGVTDADRSMALMRQTNEQIQYREMVGASCFPDGQMKNATIFNMADLKQVHGQVAAITSVLFSAAGVFTAVIYYGHYLIDDYGLRVLLALLSALFIAAVEAVLYLISVYYSERAERLDEAARQKHLDILLASKSKFSQYHYELPQNGKLKEE